MTDLDFDIIPPETDTTKRLLNEVDQLVAIEKQIKAWEDSLSAAKKRAQHLKTTIIPDLMAEAGLTEIKTEDGYEVKQHTFIAGSLPKESEKLEIAFKVIEQHGGQSLIKNTVTVEFGKSEDGEARRFMASLQADGVEFTNKQAVNHQSLLAFVRERLKAGEEITLEALGLWSGNTVKIKEPKK